MRAARRLSMVAQGYRNAFRGGRSKPGGKRSAPPRLRRLRAAESPVLSVDAVHSARGLAIRSTCRPVSKRCWRATCHRTANRPNQAQAFHHLLAFETSPCRESTCSVNRFCPGPPEVRDRIGERQKGWGERMCLEAEAGSGCRLRVLARGHDPAANDAPKGKRQNMVAWNESYVIETVHGVRQRVCLAAIRWTNEGPSRSAETTLDDAGRRSMTGSGQAASGSDRLLESDPSASSS